MLRKIINTLVTKFSSAALGMLTIIIVSQFLGSSGKGEQAIVVYNIYVLLLIFTLIGNSTLVYLTPRSHIGKLLNVSLIWIFALALVLCVFFVLFPQIAPLYILVSIPIASIAAVCEINQFILLGRQEVAKANAIKLIYPAVSFGYIGALALVGGFNGVEDCIVGMALGYLLALIYGINCLKSEYRSIRPLSKEEFRQTFKLLFSLGATKQVGSIAQSLNYRLSFYLLGFFCGESLVGIYSNGVSLSEAVMLFGSSLALVQYSALSNSKDPKSSKPLTLKMCAVNAVFTFLALVVLCLLPSEVYVFVFGEDFAQVKEVVIMLSLGTLLLSVASNFTQYLYAQGNFKISTVASLIGLAVTLIGGFVFVPRYGIMGAALTATASYCTTFAIELYYFLTWKPNYGKQKSEI